jgi:hypothetical protein
MDIERGYAHNALSPRRARQRARSSSLGDALALRSLLRILAAAVISTAGLGAAVIFAAAAMFAIAPSVAVPAGANPAGNNGTIKIDGIPFDVHPDNEPHVGCSFQVDFYGFDQGDLDAEVLFEAIPPSGHGEHLLGDTVFIGEDDNSGGGSESGLDASRTYDLTASLQSVTAQPVQGDHVKLTIHADGSQGADTKVKVFWVSGCASAPTPVTAESPGPTPRCPTPGPATPTPFNGATEESPGAGGNQQTQAAVETAPPEDITSLTAGCDLGPTPVVPEAPVAVLLPLTASAALVGALWVARARGRGRPRTARKERADGE